LRKLIIALIIVFGLLACVPGTAADDPTPTREQPLPTPVPTEEPVNGIVFYNDNYELQLGKCELKKFYGNWGAEVIEQCNPRGYILYQNVRNYPMRAEHTGAGYYIRPNGSYGDIGYLLKNVALPDGLRIIKLTFDAHFWGNIGDYVIIAEVNGKEIGVHNLKSNGLNIAMFSTDILQGVYDIKVYLRLIHPSATADSYITIYSLTVE
jgi:hypothetical protein